MRALLLRLVRTRAVRWLAGWIIGWVFEHMSFAIPARRLRETDTLLAFHHPVPAYPVHILIVPKRARRSIGDLRAEDSAFLVDLFAVVAELVDELGLEPSGYRLIANGGAYQDVPQAHFHLICDRVAQ